MKKKTALSVVVIVVPIPVDRVRDVSSLGVPCKKCLALPVWTARVRTHVSGSFPFKTARIVRP